MLVSAHMKKENIKQLDSFIEFPVSRSQVLDAIVEYCLKSPEFLKDIINREQEKIDAKING